jgi:gliding motility-associated-like protein
VKKVIILLLMIVFGLSMEAQTNPNENNDCGFFHPNAFSPNRDNTNDEFRVIVQNNCDPISYHLRIFDRYGRLVFESMDPNESWNGEYNARQVKEGVYLWQLQAVYTVPSGSESVRLDEKGSVMLMR